MPTQMTTPAGFRFDNSYARDLPGFSLPVQPAQAPAPRLLRLNTGLATALGLDPAALDAQMLVGNCLPAGAMPVAQAYAGHQFGGFSPQLGDGRAVLLGEVIDLAGLRRDIALKGSGRTPFSRGGDGYATMGPVLREYLLGEAMQALGIPTTRALAAVATGATVWREAELPGAVLVRVAASHIRVGTFQFFANRGEVDKLRLLADYAIARHYPQAAVADQPYLAFYDAVVAAQVRLVAQWMGVGFIHGVMNTDNMAISGETIDYGPCAFMDAYAAGTVFSSIDRGGRYAFGNQPLILGWNLARLAEALLPLFDAAADRAVDLANARLEAIAGQFRAVWLELMRAKLGLAGAEAGDGSLVDDLLALMAAQGADYTGTFRQLAQDHAPGLGEWVPRWQQRRAPDYAHRMNGVNPVYIARNHLVEAALAAAIAGDMAPFEALLAVLEQPFAPQPGRDAYALPAPGDVGTYRTFCGT